MKARKPRWCWRPPVTRHPGRPVRLHLRVSAPSLGPIVVVRPLPLTTPAPSCREQIGSAVAPYLISLTVALVAALSWAVTR